MNLYPKATLMILAIFAGNFAFSQEPQYSKGLEYNFLGKAFSQKEVSWQSMEALYEYPSLKELRPRISNADGAYSSLVTPFIHNSYSFTFSRVATGGLLTGKAGINVVTQETSVSFHRNYFLDGTYYNESSTLNFKEVNPMLALALERSYLLFSESNKLNMVVGGGFDLGVGMGSYVKMTGRTLDRTSEGPIITSTSEKFFDEHGHGANSLYYGVHFGLGPQLELGRFTLFCSLNMLIARLRKENAATFDMFNSGISAGIKF